MAKGICSWQHETEMSEKIKKMAYELHCTGSTMSKEVGHISKYYYYYNYYDHFTTLCPG